MKIWHRWIVAPGCCFPLALVCDGGELAAHERTLIAPSRARAGQCRCAALPWILSVSTALACLLRGGELIHLKS
jgi:hypothetical protein